MGTSRLPAFIAGAAAALVLGSTTAYAATGGSFVLGKTNRAGATTTLVSKRGPALALTSRAGKPALAVSNAVRVPRLNADRVDGLNAAAFARAAGQTGSYDGAGVGYDSDGNGVNDAVVAAAQCPPGSQLTGGGGANFTLDGVLLGDGPASDGEVWLTVVAVDEAVSADPANAPAQVSASAVCYNPMGKLPGSYRVAPRDPSDLVPADMAAKMRARLAATR